MSKKLVVLLAGVLCCFVITASSSADIKLPEPRRDGGEGIFTLIEKRASGPRSGFPNGAISDEELSTILWAASGRNRGDNGWTVPMAFGMPPYVKIFAVRPDGAFLYDWKQQSLIKVTDENILSKISGDGFVQTAPCVLVFVAAPDVLGERAGMYKGNTLEYIATGAMTQQSYLAADALDISVRYMIFMKADAIKSELKLKELEVPLCILPMGKR